MSRNTGFQTDTTRSGLRAAWPERNAEAEVLIQAGMKSMGVCLKLYALEVRVKTRICDHLELNLLPQVCKTHDLSELIIFTGLSSELADPANARVKVFWDILAQFSREDLNKLRYSSQNQLSQADADQILEALDEPLDGVFAWLSRPR